MNADELYERATRGEPGRALGELLADVEAVFTRYVRFPDGFGSAALAL